ncbi:MAG: four helix bundle protein [Bacteroidales bacterium]|jgi:four helix bundle protein|nr:four helix bundle protein [Bacteroidales bacterium]
MKKKENIIADKSYKFALRIINAYLYLSKEKQEYVLSKQLLRSGTAIGALVSESSFAQSKADFISKMHIALKEANETRYWINLLCDSNFITESMHDSILPDITKIISILASIVKTAKGVK